MTALTLNILDYLPAEHLFMVGMKWLKSQPVEVRQQYIAECQGSGFRPEAIESPSHWLEIPA